MVEPVEIQEELGLEDYASVVQLAEAVRALRVRAAELVPRLAGRKVWMVNSTARGGGVAEMLPRLVSILRELGVDTEWAVVSPERPEFFALTKRLHNLIHGIGDPGLTAADRELYEVVSRESADCLRPRLRPDDLLVVHDPQPLGMGALVKRQLGLASVFRCHIGLDEHLPQTRAAWEFLREWAEAYDYSVFSAPEYVPDFLEGRAGIIHPAIDPLGYKNRELSAQKLVGVLCNARLTVEHHPVVPNGYEEPARRLAPDGAFVTADHGGGIGVLYRPIVTQVSRWDRLKGFEPLLEAFVRMKRRLDTNGHFAERHRRRLKLARLVLAGPDPESIRDDPEGREVLEELIGAYRALSPELQEDVAIVSLPMGSRKHNELMVNALQRCSTLVVQNSLREGFGLTVTEAMWKQAPVVGSRACGIRQQIRDEVEGRLVDDPLDADGLARLLDDTLEDVPGRARLGRNAQRRVHDDFLVFSQVRRWLEVLVELLPA